MSVVLELAALVSAVWVVATEGSVVLALAVTASEEVVVLMMAALA